jgi:two-component system phosphate regulon response regulator PhoB
VSNKDINVLVVDDESAIREMIRFSLSRLNMNVVGAADARAALACISDQRPDIILMDWMMPGISGLELTRRLRRDSGTADIPIIMLTAKVTEDDKVAGLEAGTDDYVIKPFSPRELVARIKAVIRRTSPADDEGCIKAGDLVLNTNSRMVMNGGAEIPLGPTEYRLLNFFMTNQGRSYSRSQIMDRVWGSNVYLEERTVDVHIRRLRRALQPTGHHSYVQTVRGHGYRFVTAD